MKKTFTLLIFLFATKVLAYSTNISSAYAIGIFDKNGNGENIQHKKITNANYEGLCYSKIIVFGRLNGTIPRVMIGNSRGIYLRSQSIYNNRKIKIGEELTYKHNFITKGYFQVRINRKLYDSKVFIK